MDEIFGELSSPSPSPSLSGSISENIQMEQDETAETEIDDLFCSDDEYYHNTLPKSSLPIPNYPAISQHPNNETRESRRFHRGSSSASDYNTFQRRRELVAELKIPDNQIQILSPKHCPEYQKPVDIANYSRAPDGNVYYDDRCLRPFYRGVGLLGGGDSAGTNLNEGLEIFVRKRDDKEMESFGDMLGCIRNNNISLDNFHYVTLRNNLNKILETPYNKSQAWKMGVHMRKNTVYIIDIPMSPDQRQRETEIMHIRRTYWHYNFKHLATNNPVAGGHHRIDANVEYCAVIRTKLGAHRIIMGAQMDCYDTNTSTGEKYYVDLKTCHGHPDRIGWEQFEKINLLKYWIQSFVGGVPRIFVGFFNDKGKLITTQIFDREEIRQIAKAKNYWLGGVCMNFADELLCWLYGSVKDNRDYVLQFVPSENRIELVESHSCPPVITSHLQNL